IHQRSYGNRSRRSGPSRPDVSRIRRSGLGGCLRLKRQSVRTRHHGRAACGGRSHPHPTEGVSAVPSRSDSDIRYAAGSVSTHLARWPKAGLLGSALARRMAGGVHMAVVALRPVEDGDLDALFEQMRDPEGVRMAAFTPEDPDDRSALDAHMARVRSSPDITL